MQYQIRELSKIACISTRTLRYYDEIGLLKPSFNTSGYRVYEKKDVDMLQQILFYKELGFDLKRIKEIISNPEFEILSALQQHLKLLDAKKQRLDTLILNVKKSAAEKKGELKMLDKEKFEGFKRTLIDENEEKYGPEIRRKYGDETINRSNDRLMKMSKAQYDHTAFLEKEILRLLHEAYPSGDPSCVPAQKAAELHREWLTAWWGFYDPASHTALAQMYVEDERFKGYYDKEQPGTAAFLRDAIYIYAAKQQA